jgi:transposase
LKKKDKSKRDKKIRDAVKRYGYSQNEIAEYLGMHYSTISRLMKEREGG